MNQKKRKKKLRQLKEVPTCKMSFPSIIGTETEYGISVRNVKEQDPVATSMLVVSSYSQEDVESADKSAGNDIYWDYEQESPLTDARGFVYEGENNLPQDEDNTVINDILINGGRYYVDHAHPEYCTPECTTARDIVIYEKAGDLIVDLSRKKAESTLPTEQEILIYKNNTDYKGHSYGSHENYLVPREIEFQDFTDALTPFFVTRQIIAGSGKVGFENGAEPVDFQISQRADFFETEVGLSTMVSRPIINTRDEPHANNEIYRRLHVIVGDSNMSEFSIYLKIGITSLVLKLIQVGALKCQFKLIDPVSDIRKVSRDLTCQKKLRLESGEEKSPIELQRDYLNLVRQSFSTDELSSTDLDVLSKWDFVLNQLESDPMRLDKHLDWVIKLRLMSAYIDRHNLNWKDSRIKMFDLQYHDLRSDRGLYHRLVKNNQVVSVVDQKEVINAMTFPPTDTRAYFRGTCLKKFAADIHSVSWNSIVFSTGGSSLNKIFMDRPHFGNKALVGDLLNCNSVNQLVEKFSSSDDPVEPVSDSS